TAAELAKGYITAAIHVTGEGPVAIHADAVDAQGNVYVADAGVTASADPITSSAASYVYKRLIVIIKLGLYI
ncbi:hypothetical protein OHW02_17670, partial [Acinetobacter baumannii]|nr:hypothetical protein [Acinetobacter baumannii]